jgi:polar amino acid transport system substrate-binding protein
VSPCRTQLPTATALLLATVTLLSACSRSAEIQADQRAGSSDVAGLRLAVGSGTNQERILLDWDRQDQAAGLAPATLDHYANAADALLAIRSGRVDAYLGPNPNAVHQQSKGQVSVVGTVNAGWPDTTYVAATTLKGNGLVDAVEAGLQHAFADGSHAKTLERWGLSDEAVDAPVVNPQVAS